MLTIEAQNILYRRFDPAIFASLIERRARRKTCPGEKIMRADIHPTLNHVCFIDAPTGSRLLTRSTLSSKERETINGIEYHVVHCSTSGASHPAYTGQKMMLDTAGRIDKFNKRYARK